jgi:hypothetical protein
MWWSPTTSWATCTKGYYGVDIVDMIGCNAKFVEGCTLMSRACL